MTTVNIEELPHRTERRQPRQRQQSRGAYVNVGSQERWITGGLGAYLVTYGLSRPRLTNLLVGAGGALLLQRALRGHCELYAALGLSSVSKEGATPQDYFERGIHVEEAFTVGKSPEELYQFWRKFDNLPRFMKHLESVTVQDDKHSHWVALGPAGYRVEWDAQIINDEPNRLIAWRSLGAEVDNAGSVTFRPAPADLGTEVAVTRDYIPPAGKAGSWVAKLFGRDANQLVRADLRNFKRLMETGEIPTTEGQPRGNCKGLR
jgi:uncharacterized membrane protein